MAVLPSALTGGQISYNINLIGTLGGDDSWAMGINNFGHVVGGAHPSGGTLEAFFYDGSIHDLNLRSKGGPSALARAISDADVIVGNVFIADQDPFIYSGGVLTVLSPFNAGLFGIATTINISGVVAGLGQFHSSGIYQGFIYQNGIASPIGNPFGNAYSEVLGINASGHFVGDTYATLPNPKFAAFIYDGTFHDIGNLGGNLVSNANSAVAINNADAVVGRAETADHLVHAFIYQSGQMEDGSCQEF